MKTVCCVIHAKCMEAKENDFAREPSSKKSILRSLFAPFILAGLIIIPQCKYFSSANERGNSPSAGVNPNMFLICARGPRLKTKTGYNKYRCARGKRQFGKSFLCFTRPN